MPKVTIIVTFYNAEKYMDQALEGMLNQTFTDIEYIFVDDGSTDATKEKLETYAADDGRIALYFHENRGPGAEREFARKMARGDYLLFIDSDDFFEKTLVEELYNTAIETGAEVTICGAKKYDDKSGAILSFPKAFDYRLIMTEEQYILPIEYKENLFQITAAVLWNKLIKRDFLIQNDLYFGDWFVGDDTAVAVPALAMADRIGIVRQELLTYRINIGTSVSDVKDSRWRQIVESKDYIEDYLKKHGKFDLYKRTFHNRAWLSLSSTIRHMGSETYVNELYAYLKGIFLPELIENGKEYFFDPTEYEYAISVMQSDSVLDLMLKEKKKLNEHISLSSVAKYWLFPFDQVERGSTIILYGDGIVGKDYFSQIAMTKWCSVLQIADKDYQKHKGTVSPENMAHEKADYIVIAIANEKTVHAVEKWMLSVGIPQEKIVYPILLNKRFE